VLVVANFFPRRERLAIAHTAGRFAPELPPQSVNTFVKEEAAKPPAATE
jgi:hypothetical protein